MTFGPQQATTNSSTKLNSQKSQAFLTPGHVRLAHCSCTPPSSVIWNSLCSEIFLLNLLLIEIEKKKKTHKQSHHGLLMNRHMFFAAFLYIRREVNEQISVRLERFGSTWISWNILRRNLTDDFLFICLCRNLLELTNFTSLETGACRTWQGKLKGVVLVCFYPAGVFVHPCPRAMGRAIVLCCSGSFSTCLMEEVASHPDISLKEKKEKLPQQFGINAIKDESRWEVWNAEVKCCAKGCGCCFLWSEIGGSGENICPAWEEQQCCQYGHSCSE